MTHEELIRSMLNFDKAKAMKRIAENLHDLGVEASRVGENVKSVAYMEAANAVTEAALAVVKTINADFEEDEAD